jgi:hypothetical protein
MTNKKNSKKNRASAVDANQAPTLHKFRRTALNISLAAVFLMGAVFGVRKIFSPDIGFHLSSARWVLQHHAIPVRDIFTYTVAENPYVDLQWGFQLVVYGILKLFGPAGITTLTTLLTLAFGATLLWRVHRRQGRIPLTAVLMLGLFFLGNLWEIRPHLFSWIYGSLLLFILEEHNRGSRHWLPFLPVLMFLWVNSHSLYILGLVCIGSYVFDDVMKRMRGRGGDNQLICWALAAALATLINPYFIKGWLFPLRQFFMIQGASGYKSPLTGTGELLSPFRFQEYILDGRFVLFQPLLWWQLSIVLALIGIFNAGKKLRLAEWILSAGFLFIFYCASKNFGYFIMVCFPSIVEGLSAISGRIRQTSRTIFIFYGGSVLISLFLSMAAGTDWLYQLGWQGINTGTGFNRTALPVEACKFINDHKLEGRIINSWNDGGYIGWATGQKVFINSIGETMGLEFYHEYINAREPGGFPAALKKWKPAIAFVRYRVTPFWLYYLHNVARDWRMVFADEQIAVFLHDSLAPEIPELAKPKAGIDYPAYDIQEIKNVIQQVTDAGGPNLWQWLKGSAAYPLKEMQQSAYYLHTNQVEASISASVTGLKRASFMVPELMLNLGHALNARKQYDLADRCYEIFLTADNDPAMAREISLQRSNRRR